MRGTSPVLTPTRLTYYYTKKPQNCVLKASNLQNASQVCKIASETKDVMTNNMQKYDENRDIYVPPEIDTWYQLKFDRDSGYLVIIHCDRNRPLVKDGKENYYQMRRVIQRATKYSRDDQPSTIYLVLRKVLDNYKDLRENRTMKDYQYERRYRLPTGSERDLTDIANHLKRTGMPDGLIKYFFHVEDGDLIVRPVLNQIDIDRHHLDVDAMEKYVWSLKELDDMPNFVSRKSAGWYPNGKPPLFKKYKKRQN